MSDSLERKFERFRRGGDAAALGAIFDAVAPDLLRAAMHVTRDAAAADDLLQATFLTAIEARDRYDVGRPLVPWLVGILTRHAQAQRQAAARRPDARRVAAAASGGPEEEAQRRELGEALVRVAGEVPEVVRSVLVLHVRHGLEAAEIAVALGRAPGTVRSQLSRGMETIRRALPRGLLAAALTAFHPSRGLAAVREVVMAKAVLVVPATAPALLATGGLVVLKNAALAVVALLVVVALFWIGWSDPEVPEMGRRGAGPAMSHAPRREVTSGPPAESAFAEQSGVAVRSAQALVSGRPLVRGRLVRGDGAAAADVPLRLVVAGSAELQLRSAPDGRFAIELPLREGGALSLVRDGDLTPWRFTGPGPRELVLPSVAVDLDLGDVIVERSAGLVGRVLDGASRGVADATVSAWGDVDRGLLGAPAATTRTDAEGGFEIGDLPAGPICLVTGSAWHAPASHEIELIWGDVARGVELVVSEGLRVRGVVRDDLGRLLEGVEVAPFRQRQMGRLLRFRSAASGESVRTDAGGAFQIGGLDRNAALSLTRTDHAPRMVELAGVEDGFVAAVLPRLGSISGVLVDEAGGALAGSRVGVTVGGAEAVTDGEGRFQLAGLAPGEVRLVAEGPAHLPVRDVIVVVAPGEESIGVRIIARRGATLDVIAVDESGEPVAGAEVWVERSAPVAPFAGAPVGRREVARRRVDETGVARIEGLTSGPCFVSARSERHLALAPVEVQAGIGPQRVVLRLVRGAFIRVITSDGLGRPLAAVPFLLVGPDGEEVRERTAIDAAALVGPLVPGLWHGLVEVPSPRRGVAGRMTFWSPDRPIASTRRSLAPGPGETAELRLVRPSLATVMGRVRDSLGPAAGVTVELGPVPVDGQEGAVWAPYHVAQTAADGSFAIADVLPGRYLLGWGRPEAGVPSELVIEILSPGDVHEVDLVIPGGSVALTVFDELGGPIAGALLDLLPRAARGSGQAARRARFLTPMEQGSAGVLDYAAVVDAISDDGGRLVVDEVPAGDYEGVVRAPGFVAARRLLAIGDACVEVGDVVLARAARLRGRVVDSTGTPAPLVSVLLEPQGRGATRRATVAGDSLALDDVVPGRYRISARTMFIAAGPWGEALVVDLEAGVEADVILAVP